MASLVCTMECGGTQRVSFRRIYVCGRCLNAQAVRLMGVVMMSFHWIVLVDNDLKSPDSEASEFLREQHNQ